MIRCNQAKILLDKIDNSIKHIRGFANASELEKSYLAKFLVVYICGIYEEAIECIMNERTAAFRSERLSKFLQKYLSRMFRNPDIAKISDLLGMFDDAWKREIKGLPTVAKLAFDSIPTNKNLIAHGSQCNITLEDVIKYYNDSKQVIEKIDNIVQFASAHAIP